MLVEKYGALFIAVGFGRVPPQKGTLEGTLSAFPGGPVADSRASPNSMVNFKPIVVTRKDLPPASCVLKLALIKGKRK